MLLNICLGPVIFRILIKIKRTVLIQNIHFVLQYILLLKMKKLILLLIKDVLNG